MKAKHKRITQKDICMYVDDTEAQRFQTVKNSYDKYFEVCVNLEFVKMYNLVLGFKSKHFF